MDLEFLIKLNWYLESAWILRSVYISERKSTCLKKKIFITWSSFQMHPLKKIVITEGGVVKEIDNFCCVLVGSWNFTRPTWENRVF